MAIEHSTETTRGRARNRMVGDSPKLRRSAEESEAQGADNTEGLITRERHRNGTQSPTPFTPSTIDDSAARKAMCGNPSRIDGIGAIGT